jgi:hypothetical protein
MRFIPRRLGLILAGAAVLASGITVVGVSAASALQTTTTSVGGKPTATVSGQFVVLKADVVFTKIKHSPITGTVAFTATDRNANVVDLTCNKGDTPKISKSGKAFCWVPEGVLMAGSGPYTVTATYSGDLNFATSFGTTTLAPTVATTHVHLKLKPRAKPGVAAVATATVVAGKGTKGLSGSVTFQITSTDSKVALRCTNSTVKGGENVPLTGNKARCDLASGWLELGSAKDAKTVWGVTASFSGNTSDYSSTTKDAHIGGTLRH